MDVAGTAVAACYLALEPERLAAGFLAPVAFVAGAFADLGFEADFLGAAFLVDLASALSFSALVRFLPAVVVALASLAALAAFLASAFYVLAASLAAFASAAAFFSL